MTSVPTFLPTTTHDNPLKKWAVLLLSLIAIMAALYVAGAEPLGSPIQPAEPVTPANVAAQSKDEEPQDCPDGQFWRGGCTSVTGCPYGDSIPMTDCPKFAPENQTSQNDVSVEKPVETVDNSEYIGK